MTTLFRPAFLPVSVGISVTAVVLGASCREPSPDESSERSNIVLVMADDMGYSDLGCYGGEIDTPNLDRLADGGVRFTQFYNGGRCCPSRAALLTGLYPHQAGVGMMTYRDSGEGYGGNLNARCVTLGDVLRSAGYQTMFVGKWHAGYQVPARPEVRGFEQVTGICSHMDSYWRSSKAAKYSATESY